MMAILPDFLRRPSTKGSDATPTIEIDGRAIPIVIRRLGQARRMTMRLAPDGSEIRISMPEWGRTSDALVFAKTRREWLAGQLTRHVAPSPLAHGHILSFRGQQLVIDHAPTSARRPKVIEGRLSVGGPMAGLDGRIRRWLQGEAKTLFAADLGYYCARAQVPVPTLALTNARSRWGSCSGQGVIRLNWRLAMAPDAVRRSVVAHEVAHLVHFDHSPRFHAFLERIFEGDIGAANRWLKAHGRGLYAILG
jgi:predicted metal-dependent hydrolase